MQRIKWWLLWRLVFFVSQNSGGWGSCKDRCRNKDNSCCCMNYVDNILKNGSLDDAIKAIMDLEDFLEEAEINRTSSTKCSDDVALQYEPNDTFDSLDVYVNDNEEISHEPDPSSTLGVQLPRELNPGHNNTIVILKLKWPKTNQSILASPYEVYDREMVGLSVEGKNISGLQQRVNITTNLTKEINVPASGSGTNGTKPFSSTDQKILTYISLIGCSLSLITLVITVLLFITNRKVRESVSMKVHINLVIALILLNLHFLLSSTVAAVSSAGLCLYMALALHYSLLATFSWMALEGFHLYLLVVKIFYINVSRYLLKVSVVGWGVPAVIVSVVLIIDRGFYGAVDVDTSNANNTGMCYITNDEVKMVTTVGPFVIVFLFNMIMFGVTIRRVFTVWQSRETECKRDMQSICRLLGVGALLGLTWGLVFFSFGPLATVDLYLFCILNSLQGFFIFLWFVMSLRKS